LQNVVQEMGEDASRHWTRLFARSISRNYSPFSETDMFAGPFRILNLRLWIL